MSKKEAARKYVDLKVFWWSIVENKEYPASVKEQLYKLVWGMPKDYILEQIVYLENRILNAKTKLASE